MKVIYRLEDEDRRILTSVCEDAQALSKRSYSDLNQETLKDFLATIEKMRLNLDSLRESLRGAARGDPLSCGVDLEKSNGIMEDTVNEMG